MNRLEDSIRYRRRPETSKGDFQRAAAVWLIDSPPQPASAPQPIRRPRTHGKRCTRTNRCAPRSIRAADRDRNIRNPDAAAACGLSPWARAQDYRRIHATDSLARLRASRGEVGPSQVVTYECARNFSFQAACVLVAVPLLLVNSNRSDPQWHVDGSCVFIMGSSPSTNGPTRSVLVEHPLDFGDFLVRVSASDNNIAALWGKRVSATTMPSLNQLLRSMTRPSPTLEACTTRALRSATIR